MTDNEIFKIIIRIIINKPKQPETVCCTSVFVFVCVTLFKYYSDIFSRNFIIRNTKSSNDRGLGESGRRVGGGGAVKNLFRMKFDKTL